MLTAASIYTLSILFIEWIGLPCEMLHILSLVALVMSLYSLCCHFLLKSGKKKWLTVIIIANIAYVVATSILLIIYQERLKWPGLIYFLSEFVVIFVLVRWEASVRSKEAQDV